MNSFRFVGFIFIVLQYSCSPITPEVKANEKISFTSSALMGCGFLPRTSLPLAYLVLSEGLSPATFVATVFPSLL